MSNALNGIRNWFFGDCDRCGRHGLVSPTTHTDAEGITEPAAKTRCAFCIWRMIGRFTWKAITPEQKLKQLSVYVAPPSLLDYRGKPIHAAADNS